MLFAKIICLLALQLLFNLAGVTMTTSDPCQNARESFENRSEQNFGKLLTQYGDHLRKLEWLADVSGTQKKMDQAGYELRAAYNKAQLIVATGLADAISLIGSGCKSPGAASNQTAMAESMLKDSFEHALMYMSAGHHNATLVVQDEGNSTDSKSSEGRHNTRGLLGGKNKGKQPGSNQSKGTGSSRKPSSGKGKNTSNNKQNQNRLSNQNKANQTNANGQTLNRSKANQTNATGQTPASKPGSTTTSAPMTEDSEQKVHFLRNSPQQKITVNTQVIDDDGNTVKCQIEMTVVLQQNLQPAVFESAFNECKFEPFQN